MKLASTIKNLRSAALGLRVLPESVKDASQNGHVFGNKYLKSCFEKIVDKYYSQQINSVIASSVQITQYSHPSIYRVCNECCSILGILQVPDIYITKDIKGINALSLQIHDKNIILIGRMTPLLLEEDELKFLIGHELGHHIQGNIECHLLNGLIDSLDGRFSSIGTTVPDMILIPLKRWSRESEFEADIAGYRCCQDIKTVEKVFAKITPDEKTSILNEYRELSCDHPLFCTRLKKLYEYINKNK